MCVIGAKFLKDLGWVGFKNRDRNYYASVVIKKEFSGNETLMIRDTITRYTEGINEKGIGILSACLAVKDDEDEATIARKKLQEAGKYYSPIGLNIREALKSPHPEGALQYLISTATTGHTLVFTQNTCFLLEGAFQPDTYGKMTTHYEYHVREIKQEESLVVRANHGIVFPYAGYQYEGHFQQRMSSEKRQHEVTQKLEAAHSKEKIIDAFSGTKNEDPQLNPLRLDGIDDHMRTTGQLMVIPKTKELHYRSVLGKMILDKSIYKTDNTVFCKIENHSYQRKAEVLSPAS